MRNSTVTGEFPRQRQLTRSFDVFFDLRLNKPLRKQSCCWWFELPSRSLWRHCNDSSLVSPQQSCYRYCMINGFKSAIGKAFHLLRQLNYVYWKHVKDNANLYCCSKHDRCREYKCTAYLLCWFGVFWHREMLMALKGADELSCQMRGLVPQRSNWGNIASCQLPSTLVPRHRDCQNTIPIAVRGGTGQLVWSEQLLISTPVC